MIRTKHTKLQRFFFMDWNYCVKLYMPRQSVEHILHHGSIAESAEYAYERNVTKLVYASYSFRSGTTLQ